MAGAARKASLAPHIAASTDTAAIAAAAGFFFKAPAIFAVFVLKLSA